MSEPITIQPPPNSVTVMVGDEPYMIRADFSDSARITATRVQRQIAVGLLEAAIEVMRREPDPLDALGVGQAAWS